ncbi:heavy-metal-associated domain-containing protein [candidate division KSB1 bacterium]|nr:heavy-metal-associated domain-containing protein [candidate division KSB1 bacterium]
MKSYLYIAAILAVLLIVSSTVWAGAETVTIKVDGIQCPHCSERISEAVKAVPGVDSVAVSIQEKTAVVAFDGEKADVKALEKAIAAVGYDAGSTKTDNPHKCSDCTHAKAAQAPCIQKAGQTPCSDHSAKTPCKSAESGSDKKTPCCGKHK